MFKKNKFARCVLAAVTLFVSIILTIPAIVHAHNNVVVIPLAGDDVSAKLTPTTPIAKVDPNQSDYDIGILTVFDNTTKLEWQREDDSINRNWEESVDYCSSLNLDNHSDWRLPTLTELLSIVDYGQLTTPLIDPIVFPNTSTGAYSTSLRSSVTSFENWVVRFNDGETFDSDSTFSRRVRCVRTRPLNSV